MRRTLRPLAALAMLAVLEKCRDVFADALGGQQ
jgi:hypothetical protein